MWLLNTRTYELHNFPSYPPTYAILSHCWEQGEVEFGDIGDLGLARRKLGWNKIKNACSYAEKVLRFEWIWIDTCCINKTSSAELSEALNSMFSWYRAAASCLAYLNDVYSDEDPEVTDSSFRSSRWFTRGWTLQELVAPDASMMLFFSKDWVEIGTRSRLAKVINAITSVDLEVLRSLTSMKRLSVAKRMSWAAGRQTSRPEDKAYSLMGVFDVNMPILYGEGSEKAFHRLQLEIIRQSSDLTIFAWDRDRYASDLILSKLESRWDWCRLLASSPDDFRRSGDLVSVSLRELVDELRIPRIRELHFYHTNYGVHIHLPLMRLRPKTPLAEWRGCTVYLAALACRSERSDSWTWLVLTHTNGCEDDVYHCFMTFRTTRRGLIEEHVARTFDQIGLQKDSGWEMTAMYIVT